MSKPLGTCRCINCPREPHEKMPCCDHWEILFLSSTTPATDKLNQQIRDVTAGRKKIRVKK